MASKKTQGRETKNKVKNVFGSRAAMKQLAAMGQQVRVGFQAPAMHRS